MIVHELLLMRIPDRCNSTPTVTLYATQQIILKRRLFFPVQSLVSESAF